MTYDIVIFAYQFTFVITGDFTEFPIVVGNDTFHVRFTYDDTVLESISLICWSESFRLNPAILFFIYEWLPGNP